MIFTDLFESPEPCPECGGVSFSDLVLAEKHDACYNKVRSRYKVWPSAYASGALVQCRKKGAANWGNKSKNESMAEGRDMCNVCGQTPCNCTHLNEAVAVPGRRLIELFNLIYSNGGDDAVDYLLYNSPIFADYYDQYEGDLESIAAEVDAKELQVMVDELEEVAENEGLAEGYYDTGDYYDAHMGGEYGRDMSGSLAGGNRGNGPGRDDIHKGQTKHLPADPFGRASGKVPTSNKGKIYTKALPGEMDESDQAKQDTLNILKKQGVAEGSNDTVYPNAEVIKSKNGKPVGEIYQDGNGWGCFHYRADRGYDTIDSREDAIQALKDLHSETARHRPDYTIKGVAEMDKNQPSHGRDGRISHSTYGSRDRGGSTGSEHTARATTADKMMKDAHDAMMKSMSAADKVKKGWRNPNIDEAAGYDGSEPLNLNSKPSVNDIFKRALYIHDYEGYGNNMDYSEDEAIDQYLERTYGPDMVEKLNRARYQSYFGRDDGRGSGHLRSSNLGSAGAKPGQFRTTKAGVIHKQDAQLAKDKIKDRLGRHPDPALPENVNEVSDKTLISYLTKVAADAQKHPADPTKRSPEKASRSVGGFAQAFNKLDARKEPVNEISPEGPDSDEDYREWERLKDVRKQPYSPDWDDDDEKFMQKWYQERGLEETTDQEADYGKSYQDMVKRMGAKAREQEQTRPVDISDLARRLRDIEKKSGN